MKRRRSLGLEFALGLVTFAFGAPLLWIAVLAFDRAAGSTWPWPRDPSFANLQLLFDELETGRALRNSLLTGGLVALLVVLLSALAGYGLSRGSWRGKSLAGYGVLLLYSFPLAATMTPINDLARRLELFNTYQGIVLAQTAVALPLAIWLMKSYVDAVPVMLQEAAEVDGATPLRAWREILLPQIGPGLAVVAGIAFATAWADVLLVSALVRGVSMATVSLRFTAAAQQGADAPVVAALGLVYLVPVLAIFLVLRRRLLQGFASAAYAA